MASEWRDITLGDFVSLQRGHDLTETERRTGRIPVMGSAGQNGFHDTALAKGPGIVIGRSGASFGQVHFSAVDYWPHNTGLYVTDFKGNDPRFAFYFLKALDFDRYNSGSAQPSLNRNFIYPIPIRVPQPAEQKRIAEVLGALDDKIELNRRMNATLEATARALFQSWFVDFDPVQAKLDGRTPSGMDAATAALFPDSFEESPLGHIPKGWEVKTIENICDLITSGGTPARMHKSYWEPATIPWFKTGELLDGPLIDAEERISEQGLANSSCKLWPTGTILFALYASPTVGRFGVLTKPGTANQAAAALIAKPSYGMLFLMGLLYEAREELQRVAVGAAQQNINQGVLKNHSVIVPPPALARAYSDTVTPLFEQRIRLAEQSCTLATLRDTLLPKLLSGELSVREAERDVADPLLSS
jgi:type I restriction enzyme S subunit